MDELMALFATQPTTTIARALLGMYLEHETPVGTVGGYIVDCEAYLGPDDLAAHSVGMRNTPRVRAMYQEPGTIYLYAMHTHRIVNFITQPKGIPQGIMIRGLEPVDGIALMEQQRQKTGPDVATAPGNWYRHCRSPLSFMENRFLQARCIWFLSADVPQKKFWHCLGSVSQIKGNGPRCRFVLRWLAILI